MKSKFKNINEQIDRMKSLFGESRLYGNLVEDKKIVIKEQARFFRKASDLFSVAFKSFDDLATWNKFINVEIRNIDDIIKHVDDFSAMWKIIDPNIKMADLKEVLKGWKLAQSKGMLKDLPQESLYGVLKVIPEKGGMREMMYDMWLEANGMSRNLPATTGEKRIVKQNPTTGEIMVGTKNNEGIVVYKDKDGEVVFTEKVDDIDDIVDDIEDADWEEVIDGPTKPANPKNYEEILDGIKDIAEAEAKKGNKVIFQIVGEGEDGIKAAKEMMESLNGKSTDEVIDDIVEEGIDKGEIPVKQKSRVKQFLGKLFTKYPTKFWLNPFVINEGIWKKSDAWYLKSLEHGAKLSFRTGVLWPASTFLAYTLYKDYKYDRNFIAGVIADFFVVAKAIQDAWDDIEVSDDVYAGLREGLLEITNKKVDADIVKNNMVKAAEAAITGSTSGDSHISCEDIMTKNDSEIINLAFKNIKREEKARVSEILLTIKDSNNKELEPAAISEIKNKVDEVMEFIINAGLLETKDTNLKPLVQRMRKACKEKQKVEAAKSELEKNVMKDEYEVTLEGGGGFD